MTKQKKSAGQLQIMHYGAPCLRRQSARIAKVTLELKALAKEMETLMHQVEGVGLAANQVGVEKQLAVIDVGEGPIYLINPKIVQQEGELAGIEGCLSLPGLYGEVIRAEKVTVTATNLSGKPVKIAADGLLAKALQHEVDHLQGKLFIDRVDESTLHWLIRPSTGETGEKAEPIIQPTTLQDALRVFTSRGGA